MFGLGASLSSCIVAHFLIGCSLLFVIYWGSKPASVSMLLFGLGVGLTGMKRMPWNTFGHGRAEMAPQVWSFFCHVLDPASPLSVSCLSF